MLRNLPLAQPKPDATRFVDGLLGRTQPDAPPLVEYLVDESVRRPIVTELLDREWVPMGPDRASREAYLDNFIAFWHGMGYDFVRFEQGLPFDMKVLVTADTAAEGAGNRAWADEHQGSIASWDDFERFPWPNVATFDFASFEYINGHLPEGMGFISCHSGGMFEHLSRLFSVEGLCMAVYEQRDLVRAVADKVGNLMMAFYRHLLDLDRLVAIFPGDDMGFRTATLVGPDDLREIVLPWHKRFAAMTHDRGRPYFLHSCGKLDAIMDDLIDDVGIDAKHSYENTIWPIADFQARYGGRIAVLGGLDVDILASADPDEVRRETRALIDTCGPRGRFAIGSGNSIPSYIPAPNYLAMVDEALEGAPATV